MKSIRNRLLQNLLIGLILIASVTGLVIFRHAHRELDELYNAHLEQMATLMAHEWDRIDPSQLAATPIQPATKTIWEEEDYLIQVWSRDGHLLVEEIPASTDVHIPLYPTDGFHRTRIADTSWRAYRADGAHAIVQIAQPESARSNTIAEFSVRLLVPLALQIPLLILVAWVSVRRGLKPLDRLSQAIAERHPDALSGIDSDDQPLELQPLIATLNALLIRLNAALQQQRHFVADAAHELRTPIAALQLQLDLLGRAKKPDDRDHAIAQLHLGLQRATHLTQQLLSIARAETSAGKSLHQTIELSAVIESIIERHLPLAHVRQQDLGVTRLEPASICCARADIDAVLDNLVSNAIRYTPRGGRIDLATYRDETHAVIEIIDSGPGIPVAERARVFDRFYRVLDHHFGTDNIEGSGLGLAIVKTICDRYHASIDIDDASNGNGARFIVRWPLIAGA